MTIVSNVGNRFFMEQVPHIAIEGSIEFRFTVDSSSQTYDKAYA